jgi:hypothetical protein
MSQANLNKAGGHREPYLLGNKPVRGNNCFAEEVVVMIAAAAVDAAVAVVGEEVDYGMRRLQIADVAVAAPAADGD